MTRDSCVFLGRGACFRHILFQRVSLVMYHEGSVERGSNECTYWCSSHVPSQAHILIERHHVKKCTKVSIRLQVNGGICLFEVLSGIVYFEAPSSVPWGSVERGQTKRV